MQGLQNLRKRFIGNPWVFLSTIVFVPFVAAIMLNLSPSTPRTMRPAGAIERADFGGAWPFTVEKGQLRCRDMQHSGVDRTLPAVTFTAEGRTYAINGWALTYRLGEDIRTSDVWAADRDGAKISMGPIIDRGLAMCR